ncbi:MAG: RnfABCDGE type electron transport complex subunit D [Candidatus Omnitrophica bacterium]|nr:RnfABCDGE type electron transport complex subunit D [Candidatus Omnitrophota bacterium]
MIVSIAPHIKDRGSTRKIMWAVTFALIPAGAAGAFIFGIESLFIIAVSVVSAVATEAIILALRRQEMTVSDGSAVLTGLLLAYNLPPHAPLWLPAAGAFFAVAIGKQVFGGLGHNIFNPALAGRAFLMVSWPGYMTSWQLPRWAPDSISRATPLAVLKEGGTFSADYLGLFLGNRGGCIGEVCAAALLLGAAYLFLKKYITWHIPLTYILTLAAFSWAFNGRTGIFTGDILFYCLSGGLILGAFFMATDYVTSPLTAKGRVIFGAGCGLLTFLIRKCSGYPEGVSYAILIMNAVVPIIDKYTHPKWFGLKKNETVI